MVLPDLTNEILLSLISRIPFDSKTLVPDLANNDLRSIHEEDVAEDESVNNHFTDVKQQLQDVVNTNKEYIRMRIAEVQFPEANTIIPAMQTHTVTTALSS